MYTDTIGSGEGIRLLAYDELLAAREYLVDSFTVENRNLRLVLANLFSQYLGANLYLFPTVNYIHLLLCEGLGINNDVTSVLIIVIYL